MSFGLSGRILLGLGCVGWATRNDDLTSHYVSFNDRYQLELYVESYAARRGKNYVKIRISKSGVLSKMRIA